MTTHDTDITKRPPVDYQKLPLGTDKRPWPIMLRGEDNQGNRTFELGVHQSDSNPKWLPSARPYPVVMPELRRDMPVPGLLDAFEKILSHTLVYIESDAGFGKTHLASTVGRAMHEEGAIIADVGGKNLESLLFETVFDSNTSNDLIDRINKALAEGSLTEPSLKALRELKNQKDEKLLSEEGGKRVFDWKGLEESGIGREQIDSVLTSVQKYQEWNGGLRIGFKDIPGKLIRAAIEHRPLLIDEFGRRKAGTEGALQRVWEVIDDASGYDSIDIPLGNLGTFTLRKGDIPKVMVTSNKLKDGKDMTPLSDSLSSRFEIVKIPAFSKDDWAHLTNRKLAGVPISTLSLLEKGHLDEDGVWHVKSPNLFTDNLHSIHRANLETVSPLESTLIDHWPAVREVSAALAQGFHQSAGLLDPESAVLQKPDMANIRYEVDKPGDKVKKLTTRDMLRLLQQALQHTAQAEPATKTKGADYSDWSLPNIRPSNEPIEARLGDRIKESIEHWIDDQAGVSKDGIERPHLYARLKDVWKTAGITGPDSLLNKLNIQTKQAVVATSEALQWQAAINTLLQSKYPGAEGITVQQAEIYLENLTLREPQALDDLHVLTHVAAGDADAVDSNELISPVSVAMRPHNADKDSYTRYLQAHPPETLVEQDAVITTLAMPQANTALLRAISARPDTAVPYPGDSYRDNEPFMVTTTVARGSDGLRAKLHVLHARESGKTLVVAFSPSSLVLPPDSAVTVVQANDPQAAKQVNAWLDAQNPDHSVMLQAFKVRNSVPETLNDHDLADVLVSPEVKSLAFTCVDQRTALSDIVHDGTVADPAITQQR